MLAKAPKKTDAQHPVEKVREIIAAVGKSSRLQALECERNEAMAALDALREQKRARVNDFLGAGSGNIHQRIGGEEYLALLPKVEAAEEAYRKATASYLAEMDGRHARKVEAALIPVMSQLAADILQNIGELQLHLDAYRECAREIASVGGTHFFASDSLCSLEREMEQMMAVAKSLGERPILEVALSQ